MVSLDFSPWGLACC